MEKSKPKKRKVTQRCPTLQQEVMSNLTTGSKNFTKEKPYRYVNTFQQEIHAENSKPHNRKDERVSLYKPYIWKLKPYNRNVTHTEKSKPYSWKDIRRSPNLTIGEHTYEEIKP